MKRRVSLIVFLFVMFCHGTGVMAAPVSPADQKEILRTLTLAQYWIKKGDYNRAITFVDFDGMAEIVMAGYWDRMSQKEKNEITTFMKNLIKEKFPIITQRLKFLQFGAITENGNQAMCEALAVFDHTTENKDQKIQIGLIKRANEWKAVEVYILKEGFLAGLNEDKVRPILKRGGTIQEALDAVRLIFKE
ncbi:MAG TPA: hypothetical protein VMV04_15265 [Thermodesulfobacteriota bacterium]|nr:hypothetical protein [Thermodesulfobacteriota bacterium]